MLERSRDWFAQAGRDLAHAHLAAQHGHHEWACFAAQQGADRALRAAHLRHGSDPRRLRLPQLLAALPGAPAGLAERAHVLDGHYLRARYPGVAPHAAPYEQYGPLQSREAVQYAQEIYDFAAARMA